ncbi:MAG: hypothetical protein ACU84Q_03040 [Gammaproteobacteria bacterium]
MSSVDGLLPEEYQQVVAPAMKAAADLAAARGDPYLFNDLPSMLTLMVLVSGLADRYQDKWGPLGQLSPPATFKQAPIAACVMVLKEYEVDEQSIAAMTQALSKACESLQADAVFGAESLQVQKAWEAQLAEKPDLCAAHLRQAGTIIAAAIDSWEQARKNN